jgi:hypothetical protein
MAGATANHRKNIIMIDRNCKGWKVWKKNIPGNIK